MAGSRHSAASHRSAARRFACGLGNGALLGLQPCVGPDFQSPVAPVIGSYTPDRQPATESAGGKTQHLDIGRELPAEWWTLFHSPALNALIERSLRDNPNIDAARAALRVAQANVSWDSGLTCAQRKKTFTQSTDNDSKCLERILPGVSAWRL